MTESTGKRRNMSLGILGLMMVALVAGELKTPSATAPVEVLRTGVAVAPAIDTGWIGDGEVEGTIRELKLTPLSIDRLDLGWKPDDQVIDEYRRSSF